MVVSMYIPRGGGGVVSAGLSVLKSNIKHTHTHVRVPVPVYIFVS